MNKQAQLVVDAQNTLGEGPWWDERSKTLYWVDIIAKQIHRYNPDKNFHDHITVDQFIGAMAPAKGGKLICAMQNGFYLLDLNSGAAEHICDPEAVLPDNRFNDGKCDGAGRFWAGTMNFSGIGAVGSLYCLDPNGGCRLALADITISNGLAWSPDHKTMYYIDTPTREVAAFSYDLAAGTLGEKKTVIRIPQERGYPDGMTIDAEGMLWIALSGGWQVARWNPATDECLQTIDVPASQVTSCAFGGEALNELYITTARIGLDEPALRKEPLAGGLFRVKTAAAGLPTHKYGVQ